MTIFIGTKGSDTANAAIGELTGFTGGSVAQHFLTALVTLFR